MAEHKEKKTKKRKKCYKIIEVVFLHRRKKLFFLVKEIFIVKYFMISKNKTVKEINTSVFFFFLPEDDVFGAGPLEIVKLGVRTVKSLDSSPDIT